MPQDQLTPAEITEVGAAIAAAVGEALAPAFDRLAVALATPSPDPVPAPGPMPIVDAWSGGSMPTHETSAPVQAPAVPRTLAEVEAENLFLRQIVENLRERLDRAQAGPR